MDSQKKMVKREIKFRAWSKKTKKIYPRIVAVFLDAFDGTWARVVRRDPIQDKDVHHNIQPKDLILMQYTGLKDKNGVEIYEGDVVKGVAGSEHQGQSPVFYDYSVWQPFDYLGTRYGGDFEVIGNIYENPELCKQ